MKSIEALFAAEAKLRAAAIVYATCDAMVANGEPADRVRAARDGARGELRIAARRYTQAVIEIEGTSKDGAS